MEASSQGTRKQVGECEQPTLAAVENVEILDRLIDLAVLEIADPVTVVALQQHADERMKEVQMLRRRLQRERVNRHAALPQTDFEISSAE